MAGKFIVLSDIHLNLWTYGQAEARLDDQINAIGTVLQHAVDEGVDAVLWPGDIFHTQGQIASVILSKLYTVLHNYIRLSDIMVFMPGNHDMIYRNNSDWHALDFLSQFGHVAQSDGSLPRRIQLPHMPTIWPIPYSDDHDKIARQLSFFAEREGDLLMLHQGVKGVDFHSTGFVLDEGIVADQIPPGVFHAFVGHCHSLYRVSANMTVPGALQQHHFGDAGDARGYLVVDYDDTGVTRMEQIPVGGTSFHSIPFQEDLNGLEEQCKAIDLWENDFLRITDVPPSRVEEIRARLEDSSHNGVRILTRPEAHAPVAANGREVGDIQSMFDRFCGANAVDKDLMEVGRDLMRGMHGVS